MRLSLRCCCTMPVSRRTACSCWQKVTLQLCGFPCMIDCSPCTWLNTLRVTILHVFAAGSTVANREVCRADLSPLYLQLYAAMPHASAPQPAVGTRMSPVAEHGNYRRYYQYRVPDAFSEDPRLKVGSTAEPGSCYWCSVVLRTTVEQRLRDHAVDCKGLHLFTKSSLTSSCRQVIMQPLWQVMELCWFAGRRCLDVGCNSGVLTLALATRYGTASMHGARTGQTQHASHAWSLYRRPLTVGPIRRSITVLRRCRFRRCG